MKALCDRRREQFPSGIAFGAPELPRFAGRDVHLHRAGEDATALPSCEAHFRLFYTSRADEWDLESCEITRVCGRNARKGREKFHCGGSVALYAPEEARGRPGSRKIDSP